MDGSPSHFESSTNQTDATGTSGKLVSNDALKVIEIALFVVVVSTVAFFGCLANLANIIVFVKQGFQESANISLFCLSVADFGLCVASVGTATTNALDIVLHNLYLDFQSLNYIFALCRGCFNDMSMSTIVFLSLERCLCVVKPLTFRHIITKKVTVITLSIVYTEALVFQILLWSTNATLTWQHDSRTNSTRLQTFSSQFGYKVVTVYQVVNGVGLSFFSMVVVLGASCFMVYGLKKASLFRIANSSSETGKASNKSSSTVSGKDIKVVKMVVYVSAMFIICYVPFLAIFCVRSTVPDVNYMRKYHNLNETFWAIIYTTVTINSSSNIIVYLRVSSRYKEIFLATFCGREIKDVKKKQSGP